MGCMTVRAWGPSRDTTIMQSLKMHALLAGCREKTIRCTEPFEKSYSIILLDSIARGDTIYGPCTGILSYCLGLLHKPHDSRAPGILYNDLGLIWTYHMGLPLCTTLYCPYMDISRDLVLVWALHDHALMWTYKHTSMALRSSSMFSIIPVFGSIYVRSVIK